MNRKLFCIAFVWTAVTVFGQANDDVVLRAMRDEMQRSMKKLQLEQLDRPYFIAYRVVDSEITDTAATLGSLVRSNVNRSRSLIVDVRAGSYALDNSNFLSFSMNSGVVFNGYQQMPLDDNYDELRRAIWLATDGAYKKALEDLSHKRAALENKHRTEEIPDFSQQAATTTHEENPAVQLSLEQAGDLVRHLSAIFRESKVVETSQVQLGARNSTERYVTSEGTTLVRRNGQLTLRVISSGQAADGLPLHDTFALYASSQAELPAEGEVASRIREMMQNYEKLQAAPVAKEYNGPVLFEGQAAAELFARVFGASLTAEPRPVTDNEQIGQMMSRQQPESSLLNKMGARVMPDFVTVTDDPTASKFENKPLWGAYRVDEEGTPAQKKNVVDNGILKTLLTSRAPVRRILQSTGNLRGSAVAPSNLFLTASKTSSTDDLKKQLIELVKNRGLEFGIIVRRMADRSAELAYRVYPDGHEELMRNGTVSGGAALFKEILAVSDKATVYTETFTPAQRGFLPNFAGMMLGPTLVSYVVPGLLFEDMTIEPPSGEASKPPLISRAPVE